MKPLELLNFVASDCNKQQDVVDDSGVTLLKQAAARALLTGRPSPCSLADYAMPPEATRH
jgi:hypothetical protein